MNGWVYNPKLGGLLSPDSVAEAPVSCTGLARTLTHGLATPGESSLTAWGRVAHCVAV